MIIQNYGLPTSVVSAYFVLCYVGLIASVNMVLQINLDPLDMFLGDASSKLKLRFGAFTCTNNMWRLVFMLYNKIGIELRIIIRLVRRELF